MHRILNQVLDKSMKHSVISYTGKVVRNFDGDTNWVDIFL